MLLFAILMMTSPMSLAADDFICGPFPVPTSAVFATKVSTEVSAGCGGLRIEVSSDHEKERQNALKSCCERAAKFVKDEPLPDAEPAQLKYSLKLAKELCDKIPKGRFFVYHQELEPHQHACLEGVSFAMKEPQVDKISQECHDKAHDKVQKSENFGDNLAHQFHADDLINHTSDMEWEDEEYFDCRHKRMSDLLSMLNSQTDNVSSSLKASTVKVPTKLDATAPVGTAGSSDGRGTVGKSGSGD